MLCALQSYDRRKKFLKKEKEREKWSQIDYRYMTEESDSDDVIRQHKLTWRSESEFNTLVLNYVLKFLYLFFQLSAVSLKSLTNAMLNNKSMGSSSSRRENFQQLQCLLHPQAIHHGLFRIYLLNIVIGERERANLIVQRARFFWYIYIYLSRAMPYRKPSTRFQINATYDISQKFTTCV